MKWTEIDKRGLTPDQRKELLSALFGEEQIVDKVLEALVSSRRFRNLYYQKAYEGLKNSDNTYKYWSELLTEIYEGDLGLNEIFVRLVEEQEGVAITSAEQLQKLTDIYELGLELEGEDAKAEARRQMEDTFTKAMIYRYALELEDVLRKGGKYVDLLKTDPAKYHLTDSDRETAIQEAIYYCYELGETPEIRARLRDIAEVAGAPYETVVQASKLHEITPEN